MDFAQLSMYAQRATITTFLILAFIGFLVVHGYGGSGFQSELSSEIDCDELQGLCVGETYRSVCSIPEDYLFQQVLIEGGNCTDNKVAEFDYITTKKIDETENDSKCGKIKGVSSKHGSKNTIQLTLNVSQYIDGARVTCFGQTGEGLSLSKTCDITMAGVPLKPTNVSISNSECSSPFLVTWEQPSSSSKADEYLSFFVTVNSSLGYNETFNTSNSFIFLDKIVAEARAEARARAEDITSLTVCVSTRNCFGLSPPVCRKILIVSEEAPLPPPLMNVTILNSTAVQLSIELNSTASGVNTCFDIERNFRITRRCISETEIILDMQRESHKGIHTIRARASQYSHGKVVPGQWSKPACVTFAPPLPLLFLNHTIVKSGQHSNATLKLSIELQDSSNFVGICHIPQVQEISISIGGAVQHNYNISRNAMKQEMSFKLEQAKSEQVVKISATPLSIVGPGPEQVTYVHISSGTCLNAYCLSVFIGTLLVSLFVVIF